MSFNSQHINISRDNYEEYFLLYVDGELTPEQCTAVEAFAAAHPDLQEELDILLTTKLDTEPIAFLNKDSLLADSMKANVIDESLLLYIDNELDGNAKEGVEQQLRADPEYQRQYDLLQKTKLDKNETIVYPHKEELYRSTEERRKPAYWWQVAAAAAILLGWSIFSYLDETGSDTQDPVVALQNQPAPTTPAIGNDQSKETIPSTSKKETEQPGGTTQSAGDITNAPAYTVNKTKVTPASSDSRNTEEQVLIVEPVGQVQPAAVVDLPQVSSQTANDVAVARVEELPNNPQQNINTSTVTPGAAKTYNTVDASNATGVQETVAKGNDRKGSLRGFLRKTTRFIERRTGIDPTNGDDELMIGAVAIKL